MGNLNFCTFIKNRNDLTSWSFEIPASAYCHPMGIRKLFSKPEKFELSSNIGKGNFFKLFVEGFLMSAANPKAIVFFAALFPLFLDDFAPMIPQIIILGITFLIIDGLSLLVYSTFAETLKSYLESREKMHLQNRIVGGLLILSGIMLSMIRRV